MDSRNLSTQVVLLSTEVEGIRHDLTLKVTGKADLDLTSCSQVLRVEIGKNCPGSLRLVGNVVGVLINALSTSLATLRSLIFRQVLCVQGLNNVVVINSARNLAPEL